MSMSKKGSTITMDGAAASLNSVANFITALKRSGYFQKVEIKDAKQDEKNQNVQTFLFSINAEIAPNGPLAAAPAAKPASTPSGTGPTASAPAKKG
jgi:Tfp pilus assembly protein PilN